MWNIFLLCMHIPMTRICLFLLTKLMLLKADESPWKSYGFQSCQNIWSLAMLKFEFYHIPNICLLYLAAVYIWFVTSVKYVLFVSISLVKAKMPYLARWQVGFCCWTCCQFHCIWWTAVDAFCICWRRVCFTEAVAHTGLLFLGAMY